MTRSYKFILGVLAMIGINSCYVHKPDPELLDYTWSSAWGHTYSLKIFDSGKAYLRKNIKGDSLFVKSLVDLKELHQVLLQIPESVIDTTYQELMTDGETFRVVIYSANHSPSKYTVHAGDYPEPLKNLDQLCKKLSNEKGWIYLKDTTVVFASTINILQPQPKIDQVAFPPPPKHRHRKARSKADTAAYHDPHQNTGPAISVSFIGQAAFKRFCTPANSTLLPVL